MGTCQDHRYVTGGCFQISIPGDGYSIQQEAVWQQISRTFSEGRPSAGYIVFNKPKYNPGDTVML